MSGTPCIIKGSQFYYVHLLTRSTINILFYIVFMVGKILIYITLLSRKVHGPLSRCISLELEYPVEVFALIERECF